MKKKRLITMLVAATLVVLPFNSTAAGLQAVGAWDGITQREELSGNYVDDAQQEVPFGARSFFHTAWRSYMDTWSGDRFLDSLGVVFNVSKEEAEAAATLLEEAGIGSARIEIGWTNVDYNDETKLRTYSRETVNAWLQALKRHQVRPIILLNLNSGMPSPNTEIKAKVTQRAEAGAREIYLDNVADIKPKYTGLKDMGPAMYPVITEVDAATGRCVLSAPLPKGVAEGELSLVKLKYQPFSGPVFADGTPNPASQETLDGWMTYVRTIAQVVREELGTLGAADAGFDIEVYNEYTFGYHFLSIDNYYSPKLEFAAEMSYSANGQTVQGSEVLLPLTANFFADPANGFPGVRVISGFSNQRPWDNGGSIWPGQAGFSRHYYTGYDPVSSTIAVDSASSYVQPNKHFYDALGMLDSIRRPDSYDQPVPGSYYVPAHTAAFPELWSYFYQTESMIRDLEPFPGPWTSHYRFASPGNGQTAELWMTESNFWRGPWAKKLIAEAQVEEKDPQLSSVLHHVGAKALGRLFTFYAHKGVETINVHALKGGDHEFSIIPTAFFEELKENNYQLTSEVRAKAGPQLEMLRNISQLMRSAQPMESTRPLQVTNLVEYQPRLVFAGDGSQEHPDLYNRDDFAVLPYQLNDHKFAVGYYVVTRNITQAWDETKSLLDPGRYDMPEQTFELTLSNISGTGAAVSAYDPATGQTTPVQVLHADDSSITVLLQTVDYPRFLLIDEAVQGPVIAAPLLQKTADGAALSFVPNVDGTAHITYGEYPVRSGGTFKEQYFADKSFATPLQERTVEALNSSLAQPAGAWRWTGTIVPQFSETYMFTAYTDNMNGTQLKINGRELNLKGTPEERSLELTAGEAYQLEWSFFNQYAGNHSPMLFWSSASQERSLVPAAVPAAKTISLPVAAGQAVAMTIPGMKNGDGVKIKLTTTQGIGTRYPFWDYDTKLVLYEGTPYASAAPPVFVPIEENPGEEAEEPEEAAPEQPEEEIPVQPEEKSPEESAEEPAEEGGGTSTDPSGGSGQPASGGGTGASGGQSAAPVIASVGGGVPALKAGNSEAETQSAPGDDTSIIRLDETSLEEQMSSVYGYELELADGQYTIVIHGDFFARLEEKRLPFSLIHRGSRVVVAREKEQEEYILAIGLSKPELVMPAGFAAQSSQIQLLAETAGVILMPAKSAEQQSAALEQSGYLYQADFSGQGLQRYVWGNQIRTEGIFIWLRRKEAFQDIVDHWGRKEIEELAAKGYVSGYSGSIFQPDKAVSRVEFTAMLARMVMPVDAGSFPSLPFVDVTPNDWFYNEVGYGYSVGLVNGVGENEFDVAAPITRQEMAAMAVRLLERYSQISLSTGEGDKLLEQWNDRLQISGWARESMAKAVKLELVGGTGQGRIEPGNTATRGEAAVILARVLEQLERNS